MRLNHASKNNLSCRIIIDLRRLAKPENEKRKVMLRIHKPADQNLGFVPDIHDQSDSRFVS
jgi:hypothetical protein